MTFTCHLTAVPSQGTSRVITAHHGRRWTPCSTYRCCSGPRSREARMKHGEQPCLPLPHTTHEQRVVGKSEETLRVRNRRKLRASWFTTVVDHGARPPVRIPCGFGRQVLRNQGVKPREVRVFVARIRAQGSCGEPRCDGETHCTDNSHVPLRRMS